jgi:hypothetical protein
MQDYQIDAGGSSNSDICQYWTNFNLYVLHSFKVNLDHGETIELDILLPEIVVCLARYSTRRNYCSSGFVGNVSL